MFCETRFPDDISYGAVGGPQFSTDTVLLRSGKEHRNRNWQQARMRYNVAFGLRTPKQAEALMAFFYARGGKAEGFRFKDWTDFQAKGQALGVGDGITTNFQLVKHYTSGSTYTRPITKPVAGSVHLYEDGVLINNGYTIDYEIGIIAFTQAPALGAKLKADFEFDVPVRFDMDYLPITHESKGVMTVKELLLVEVSK